jgi:hypothetical protein
LSEYIALRLDILFYVTSNKSHNRLFTIEAA